MEHSIILRELKKEDRKALEDIIRKTWDYDKFASPKTAKRLAGLYLAACLTNQTYTRTAVLDGKPVGLILGKNIEKHHCPFKYRIHQFYALMKLIWTKEGRTILSFYRGIAGIDKKLLSKCSKRYKGEVALFAIDSKYRGKGIGKKLFQAFLSYMKSECISDFYLYTDTSCNFGFYEHQGMVQRQKDKQTVTINGQTNEMEFYLYDMAVR